MYYVRVFWGFLEPPSPLRNKYIFTIYKVSKGKLPFSEPPTHHPYDKFFIMSTEFDKNISD